MKTDPVLASGGSAAVTSSTAPTSTVTSEASVAVPSRKILKPGDVDREKTCPLLLRVFTRAGGHHPIEEYQVRGKEPLQDELQIHTWRDATLRELTELIKEVREVARRREAKIGFAFVYPDKMGRNVIKEVGSTWGIGHSEDENKTLDELHFEVGDFLDVSLTIADAAELRAADAARSSNEPHGREFRHRDNRDRERGDRDRDNRERDFRRDNRERDRDVMRQRDSPSRSNRIRDSERDRERDRERDKEREATANRGREARFRT
ncbi:histone deacetylase complex subunit SAP18 [Pelomyxa schiedti]|nr:histone deacetylase complex subunit SAP18 [Pelomyxa schiedti]